MDSKKQICYVYMSYEGSYFRSLKLDLEPQLHNSNVSGSVVLSNEIFILCKEPITLFDILIGVDDDSL